MGYCKMIKYGSLIEIKQYEKSLSSYQRGGLCRSHKGVRRVSVVASNGGDSGQNVAQRRKDNASRSRMVFLQLVASNLSESSYPLLVTLTYATYIESVRLGYQDFRSFIISLRNTFGKEFRYVAVPEFQSSGRLHFHALFWGLPASVYKTQRSTRLVDRLWGHGFVYMKETDGKMTLAGYLAKYMSKAYLDPRMSAVKAFTASRNIIRPLIQEVPRLYDVYSDYELSTDMLLTSSVYMTRWLGKCRANIYQLSTP